MQSKLIETTRLKIKTPKQNDVLLILDFILRNKTFFKERDPIRESEYFTKECHLKKITDLQKSDSEVKFYIFRKEIIGKIIGEIGISNISRGVFQNCNIGYKLDQNESGRGFMYEALEAIKDFIFNELELHRIEANIIPRNTKSIKLIEKLGFRKEGLSKRLLKINGKWEDHFRYALTIEDYKKNEKASC